MGRTRAARALIEELIRRKQECIQRKQVLERYLQRLHENYSKHEISYSRYVEILYKKTNGKTLHEWIEYYEQSIVNCDKEIKQQKRSISKTQIPIVIFSFVFIFLLANVFFNFTPVFIGFLIQEPTQTFTETLNLQFAETYDYSWFPTNLGTLNSVKLSGNIQGQGNVKIYLDDLLILENSNLNPGLGITGSAISEDDSNDISLIEYIAGFFYKSFLTITGQATEEPVKETNESNKSFSEDTKKSEIFGAPGTESSQGINEEASPKEDLSPSQEEPLPSEEISEELEEPAENITEKGITKIPIENITEDVEENITEEVKEIPDFVKEFIDLCDETCDLTGLNLNKTSYTLRVEISNPNTIVNINEIKYEIIPFLEEVVEEPVEEIPEINITEPIVPTNITNITEIISLENVTATIQTTQFQAVIGKPVKWRKDVQLDKKGRVKLTLPKDATNISVFKITKELREELEEQTRDSIQELEEQINAQEEPLSSGETIEEPSSETEPKKNITEVEETIEQTKENVTKEKKEKVRFTITAQVIEEKDKSILDYVKEIFSTITGAVVDIEETLDFKEVTIDDNSTVYEIEYETPAPITIEEPLPLSKGKGKRVKISSPENLHYENVLAFTNLSESLNIQNPGSVKIHWVENNIFLPVKQILDTNNNGIYDYIEWIAPELSNQTFDIIVITKAEHLDSNREFISDIFEQVKELDNIWSETIPDQDYVRVTFEIPLDSTRDITLYPRTISGNPRIEVYEFNSSEVIAEFTSLNDNEYNKVFLNNLNGSQDTFDLRIIGGSVEFDHIIDPSIDTKVISVENFGLAMAAGVVTASAAFTKSQNMSNSVPFVTKSMSPGGGNIAEDWQHHLTEVTLDSTGVILTRAGSIGALEYEVAVVEFDASSVKVQNGSLCSPTIAGCNTAIGVSVNTSRAALIFYSQISGTVDDDYNSAAVRGNITNSTHLTFSRTDTTITITGTWYVFESLDGSMTVQNRDLTLPNNAETATVTIDSVQTNKTFLIASYQTTENSDNARDGSTRVELTDSTTITATRQGTTAADSIDLVVFAITFSGNEKVQRGTLSFTDAATAPESIRNDSLNTVDLNLAMPWNPVLTGRMSSDGTGEGDLQGAFSRLEFVNSTSIQGTRGKTGGATTASYEVIEWAVTTPGHLFGPSFGLNPIDNSNESSSSVTFEFKASDEDDIDYIRLYGNWTTGWHANYTNTSYINNTYLNITVNNIPEGKYIWGIFANDSAGDFNWTNTNRTFTVVNVTLAINLTTPNPVSCTESSPCSQTQNQTSSECNSDMFYKSFRIRLW